MTLLLYLLYCSGLELNPQYLLGMPVLSAYHVPGTLIGPGNTAMNKSDKNPYPHGVYVLMGKTDNK